MRPSCTFPEVQSVHLSSKDENDNNKKLYLYGHKIQRVKQKHATKKKEILGKVRQHRYKLKSTSKV